MPRQKITTFLWYDQQAEEAARFYVSLFKDSRIDRVTPGPNGAAFLVEFELAGVPFMALNGGPQFQFTEAASLYVDCADQAEIDFLWEKLSEGSAQSQCGWVKDRYGLWWQLVPAVLGQWMSDPARSGRVMQALLQMGKIEIDKLQAAFDGE